MNKYILKDADLQHHLDAISGGEFSEALKSGNVEFDEDGFATVRFGSSTHENNKTLVTEKFSGFLHKDEVSFQYDPDAWNSFPEVTPPEGVLMRVEIEYPDGDVSRTCAIFKDEVWWEAVNGEPIDEEVTVTGKVKRFRPWE